MALEDEVEEKHGRGGDGHPCHRQRDLIVVAALEDRDPGHDGLLGVVLEEDDGHQQVIPDEESIDDDEGQERRE